MLLKQLILRLKLDRRGQDLIEYALMAGILSVGAGAVLPAVAKPVANIFNLIGSTLNTVK